MSSSTWRSSRLMVPEPGVAHENSGEAVEGTLPVRAAGLPRPSTGSAQDDGFGNQFSLAPRWEFLPGFLQLSGGFLSGFFTGSRGSPVLRLPSCRCPCSQCDAWELPFCLPIRVFALKAVEAATAAAGRRNSGGKRDTRSCRGCSLAASPSAESVSQIPPDAESSTWFRMLPARRLPFRSPPQRVLSTAFFDRAEASKLVSGVLSSASKSQPLGASETDTSRFSSTVIQQTSAQSRQKRVLLVSDFSRQQSGTQRQPQSVLLQPF